MRRSFLRRVAISVVAALWLAQVALAACACPLPVLSGKAGPPVAAHLGAAAAHAATAPHADCAGMQGMADPAAARLCVQHCTPDQQSDHASLPGVPAACPSLRYVVVPEPARGPPALAACTAVGLVAAAPPPHAILHCCWRI